jgi:hypothetical protein
MLILKTNNNTANAVNKISLLDSRIVNADTRAAKKNNNFCITLKSSINNGKDITQQ